MRLSMDYSIVKNEERPGYKKFIGVKTDRGYNTKIYWMWICNILPLIIINMLPPSAITASHIVKANLKKIKKS